MKNPQDFIILKEDHPKKKKKKKLIKDELNVLIEKEDKLKEGYNITESKEIE